MTAARTPKGQLIARALTGAWRASPPAFELSAAELRRITPLLYSTGAGALVWRLVRETPLRTEPSALELQQADRLQMLRAARSELDIQHVFRLLRGAGIEPLLFKGWAAARLYPAEGLRPWGDIDLYVHPHDYERAQALLLTHRHTLTSMIDLYHVDLADLDERGSAELYARSQLVALGDVMVRVPCAADHLRLLCLHWLRHHACRPLWLCDIAAALEHRRTDFSWPLALRGPQRQREWIACALALAHRLLGADVSETPVAASARALPRWLEQAVLKQWCWPIRYHEPDNVPLLTLWPQRPGLVKALRARWPSAIEATYGRHGPFTRRPLLVSQLRLYLARAVRFQMRLLQLSH